MLQPILHSFCSRNRSGYCPLHCVFITLKVVKSSMEDTSDKKPAYGIIAGLVIGFLLSLVLGFIGIVIGGIASAQVSKGSRKNAVVSGGIIGILVGFIQAYSIMQTYPLLSTIANQTGTTPTAYASPIDIAILLIILYVVSGIAGGFIGHLVFGNKKANASAPSRN